MKIGRESCFMPLVSFVSNIHKKYHQEMEFTLVFLAWLATSASAQTTPREVCGDTSHYGPSGVISSPNYPDNYYNDLNCNYYIYASTGNSLSLIFEWIDVEKNLDDVTISCPTNSSFTPQEYSGNSLPDPISIPWCSQGKVNFITDRSNVLSGFSIDYYVSVGGCGNTVYTGLNGNVTSSNWPNNYGENQNCSNIIWAPQRNTFHLDFVSFQLQNNCSSDWLEIRCLDNADYGPYRYCGTLTNHTLDVLGCSQLLLWFHSDDDENHQGFNIEYNVFPDEACGNTSYDGPSGIISSPNHPGLYDDSLYCEYYIYASTRSSLSFIFKVFHLEDGFDFVTISCPANVTFPPHKNTGHTLPDPVSIPWCSKGLVYISTDDSISASGFSLDYYVSVGGCGNTLFTETQGYVTSPNYPSYYGNDHSCLNIIWAPQRSTFHLNSQSFDLDNCCDCDWLEISCLDNSAVGPYKYCGSQSSFDLDIQECSQVLLWFHSDGFYGRTGFNIQYNVYSTSGNTSVTATTNLPTNTVTPSVGTTTTTTISSTTATGTTTTGTTTTVVPQDCGNTNYYGPSGVISSPNHPDDYPNYLACDYYVIASSSSSSIALIFTALDTQQCCDHVTINCPTNSFYPSVKYSGASLPQPLSIPWCSLAAVIFTTDGSTVSTGFSLEYHVSLGGCGNTVFTELHGYVSSPNYPSGYDSNQNCSNIIWSRLRSSFSITFLYMNVEECCDFVELSCLDNAGFGSHRFTGSTIPDKLEIPGCTQVLVWFNSDESVVQNGFNLEYLVKPDSNDPNERKVSSHGAPNAKEIKEEKE